MRLKSASNQLGLVTLRVSTELALRRSANSRDIDVDGSAHLTIVERDTVRLSLQVPSVDNDTRRPDILASQPCSSLPSCASLPPLLTRRIDKMIEITNKTVITMQHVNILQPVRTPPP